MLQPISTKILPSRPIGCREVESNCYLVSLIVIFPPLSLAISLTEFFDWCIILYASCYCLIQKGFNLKKNLFKNGQQSYSVITSPWYRVVRCVSREDNPYKEQSLRRTGFRAGGVSSSLKMASLNLCKTVH